MTTLCPNCRRSSIHFCKIQTKSCSVEKLGEIRSGKKKEAEYFTLCIENSKWNILKNVQTCHRKVKGRRNGIHVTRHKHSSCVVQQHLKYASRSYCDVSGRKPSGLVKIVHSNHLKLLVVDSESERSTHAKVRHRVHRVHPQRVNLPGTAIKSDAKPRFLLFVINHNWLGVQVSE